MEHHACLRLVSPELVVEAILGLYREIATNIRGLKRTEKSLKGCAKSKLL
jgi:hypothetical protein